MLSAQLIEPGHLQVRDTEEPHPGPGEVVLRVRSALTCGRDLRRWREGTPGPLGQEYAGEVVAVGEGVRGFREGDEVMTVAAVPCGECVPCRRGQGNLCERFEEGMALGGFAERIRVPAPVVLQGMFRKPRGLPYREAAFLDPLARVVQALEGIPIEERDTVVILGAGPIGLLFLEVVREAGPRQVLLAGRGADRLAMAREMGADRTVDTDEESVVEAVRVATDGHGAEVVIECTGSPEMYRASVEVASRGSEVVLFGGCPGGVVMEYDTARLHYDQITLRGACHFTPRSVRSAYELLASHTVRPGRLVTGSAPLRELESVLQRLDRGDGVKFEILPEVP